MVGVFTKSATAASVLLTKKVIKSNDATVNAGNANAFTGKKGERSAISILSSLSKISGLPLSSMMMASTGVIGEPLNDDLINFHLKKLWDSKGEADWYQAATAIKTTDTFSKVTSQIINIDGNAFAE